MSEKTMYKPVETVTKALNKKGILRGKDKHETKFLKSICTHHKVNKKGRVKPTIFNNQDGTCVCKLCGARFPSNFFTENEIDENLKGVKSVLSQGKFMSVAIDAGPKNVDYWANTSAMVWAVKKNYKKLYKVASKQGKIKNKKNKSRGGDSSQYGSWGSSN